jgi:hypothetical protein
MATARSAVADPLPPPRRPRTQAEFDEFIAGWLARGRILEEPAGFYPASSGRKASWLDPARREAMTKVQNLCVLRGQ